MMPPKATINRETLLACAVELVRREGADALNARSLAAAAGCSTQPVFSNFDSMETLRAALVESAEKIYFDYIARENRRGLYPTYKASGMAYIRFAQEDRELFKLLFMRQRASDQAQDSPALMAMVRSMVKDSTGLVSESGDLFHLEMWAAVHGIATMLATGYLTLEEALISNMLTDIYRGLQTQFRKEPQ